MILANTNSVGARTPEGAGGGGVQNIATLGTVSDIFVPYRTAFGANGVGVGLPATLSCTFDGGGNGTVDMTWAIGSYNSGAQGSTVAFYTDAGYSIVGTPVETGSITNTGNVTRNANVTVRDVFHPLTATISAIWDTTQLVTNSTNSFGTVNVSGGITSVLSQAPGPTGRNLANFGTAPQLSGNKAVFIGTGAFQEVAAAGTFLPFSYDAVSDNFKRTMIIVTNPTDTGAHYGILGDNGFFSSNNGFDVLIWTNGASRFLEYYVYGGGGVVTNAGFTDIIDLGVNQVLTLEVDRALANGSNRVRAFKNTTEFNTTSTGTNALDNSPLPGKLQMGDCGTSGTLDMQGTMSMVVMLEGKESDSVRTKLIEDIAFYTGVTL